MTTQALCDGGVVAGSSGSMSQTSPAGAGLGLRHCHLDQVLREAPDVPWFELLADNHFGDDCLADLQVRALAERYPLTLHCVGMNIAGVDPLDLDYLRRVASLSRRSAAAWVSDHLCFTAVDGRHYHELLPFPYTEGTLRHVAARVQRIQDCLGRTLVLENVSRYLQFAASVRTEAEFLAELCQRTDCDLLLDVNNLYVNQVNHAEDAVAALDALPLHRVREIHLAGHAPKTGWLLDAHDRPVAEPVWSLYGDALRRCRSAGLAQVPTLIEWDTDIPSLQRLRAEANRAQRVASQVWNDAVRGAAA